MAFTLQVRKGMSDEDVAARVMKLVKEEAPSVKPSQWVQGSQKLYVDETGAARVARHRVRCRKELWQQSVQRRHSAHVPAAGSQVER